MQVNGPFEKQQDTSARLVCQAIRDLRPHLETQVSLPGPAGDQTSGIMHTPACRCAGPPSSGTVPSWGTRGGGVAGWMAGHHMRPRCPPPCAAGAPGSRPYAPRRGVEGAGAGCLGYSVPRRAPPTPAAASEAPPGPWQAVRPGAWRRHEAPPPWRTSEVPSWPFILTWLRQSSPLAFASTSTSISTASGLVT